MLTRERASLFSKEEWRLARRSADLLTTLERPVGDDSSSTQRWKDWFGLVNGKYSGQCL